MGGSYELTCTKCGYDEVFRFGLDFLYSYEMLFEFQSGGDLLKRLVQSNCNFEKIRELIQERHAIVSLEYGHDIYRCRNCGKFQDGFYLRLDYEGGYFEPSYKCHDCGFGLERTKFEESEICARWHIDMQHEKYPCPMCGEYSLKRSFEDLGYHLHNERGRIVI